MPHITLLPGVDRHGPGFRVRLSFRGQPHIETGFTDHERANARSLELRELRKQGLMPAAAPTDPPLAEIGQALKKRKATRVSPKTGRKLRPTSVAWWERIIDPWIEEFGKLPVSMLSQALVDDALAEVALDAIPEANNRLTGIKALLRFAESRGHEIDRSILTLEEIPHTPRERVALSGGELEFLVARAPAHGRAMLLFKGTVGNRWGELASWVDERFDPVARTMFVPAGLCKEGVDKTIDLTPEEVRIAQENQLARAPGSRHIFPTATGLTWAGRYGDWHRDVWQKAVSRAARAWREKHGLAETADTPFEWQLRDESDEPRVDEQGEPVLDRLEPHDLRATAITLMRDAGFTKEQTAARVGHADSGKLIDRIYDRGDRRARAGVRAAIDELTPQGLRAALGEAPAAAPYNGRSALSASTGTVAQ